MNIIPAPHRSRRGASTSRARLAAVLGLAALGVLLTSAPAAERRPPNLIVILADDLGETDLGCYGSDFHLTPNLDRLAGQGARFTASYAAGPVCSPTRAALLTGQHPARLHLTDWLPGRGDQPNQKLRRPAIETAIPSGTATLAERLKSAGYATAHVGKWHLGGKGQLPTDRGFDVNIGGDQRGSPASYFAPYTNAAGVMPALTNAPAGEYLTDRLGEEADRFITANREKPFLLYLAHYSPHIPLQAKADLIARHRARVTPGKHHTNAIYAAMLESLDDSVGRVLRRLDELQLADRTIVLFTSDNGGLSTREGPNTPATDNQPWRAGKGYLYEGGLRVPLIVRWPGMIPAGRVVDTPVTTCDLLPTLLAAAGAGLASGGPLDGRDMTPVWTGEGVPAARTLYWHYPHYSNQGGRPGGAIREGDLKLIEHYESGYLELFDLARDPRETTNLATAQPNKANELARKLGDWRKAVGAQMMTTNPAWVPSPIRSGPDGRIVLPAHEALVHGKNLRYEPPAHKNTLGFWTLPGDWVSWPIVVPRAGRYAIDVLQGCGKGSGGSDVDVAVGNVRVKFRVLDTGHFQNFVSRNIAEVQLEAGPQTVEVRPVTKPGVAVMDLRQVTIRPLD